MRKAFVYRAESFFGGLIVKGGIFDMKQSFILFDLDGTLTDSGEGIMNSAAYALRQLDMTEENPARLRRFVGPPLKHSFMEFYGMEDAKAEQAIALYREYYTERGIRENRVYDGVEAMLARCVRSGKTLALATSKPTVFAQQILDDFGLSPYFSIVCGSNLDGTRVIKAEIIAQVLCDAKVEAGGAVMVGDRKHDVIGAKECGVFSVGVTYGYGSREELLEYGADAIVDRPEELAGLLCS